MIFFFVSVINDFFLTKLSSGINNQRRSNGSITQNTETTFAFNPFFFNTECNFGKKRAVFESGNLVDKTKHFFFTNSIIQTKPAWKKRNFFVSQKTLHWTKPLLFDGKTLHLTKSFFSEFGGVLLWFLLLHQNNCFETKGFLSPICNQQMTNFGKGKIFGGEKKIDTFRSPTRELILDACHFVDKTRKAAGQLNNHTFPFSSRLHSIFFIVPFFLFR